MLPVCIETNHQRLQLKLSTIFSLKIAGTRQAFGSFYDANGERYCAVSALSKYLGYDVAATSKQIWNGKDLDPEELIPSNILEIIENFDEDSNPKNSIRCFCSRPDYYSCYSLISLLIHLNDYHKMTFIQIGRWLDSKGM